ncbi:hypothetical protein L1987_03728 [Smallanthus sonchifolius]|uniref:Uncharacterized protein n=1 Tax=Smallanthus sonchifolius TaxID=185202 RepID=A0ACB9KBG5_9ASTR|nr:hypothetical protein L1987_03728 [Smallanthus sonchifolius]
MMALLFSANEAATAVGMIGLNGNSHTQWHKMIRPLLSFVDDTSHASSITSPISPAPAQTVAAQPKLCGLCIDPTVTTDVAQHPPIPLADDEPTAAQPSPTPPTQIEPTEA